VAVGRPLVRAGGQRGPEGAGGVHSGKRPDGEARNGRKALLCRLYVGPESEITAKENGRRYLAMNDLFSALWDDTGEMKATIRVRYPKPTGSESEG
jgi:hypothetical protein